MKRTLVPVGIGSAAWIAAIWSAAGPAAAGFSALTGAAVAVFLISRMVQRLREEGIEL